MVRADFDTFLSSESAGDCGNQKSRRTGKGLRGAWQADQKGMKTHCRMLTEDDSAAVLKTMVAGFSDYIIKIDIDEDGYRQKFALDGVEYSSSVGIFDNDRLIGVTMNGVDKWLGKKTVYDAGTVVLSEHRNKGASTRMFEYQLPKLSEMGFETYLLEVICDNEPALRLYNNFGFQTKRELGVFYKENEFRQIPLPAGYAFKKIALQDVETSNLYDDTGIAWQNSISWIRRSENTNYGLVYIGLIRGEELMGIGIVSPRSGKVLRVHVSEGNRRKGFGTLIVNELQKFTAKPLVFLNQDLADADMLSFLESNECVNKVGQFEMELEF